MYEQQPTWIPLKAESYVKWGITPEKVFTVVILNENKDFTIPKPDYGVIITKSDGELVRYVIHGRGVKAGDKIKFSKKTSRRGVIL